jgi:hypothetical protein
LHTTSNIFKFHWHMALKLCTLVHHLAFKLLTGGGYSIKHFDIIMPLFRLRIYVKVCVPPQIFSKSIDVWLWNFAHLFTIMPSNFKQEEVTLSSFLTELCPFFDLEFSLKFAYHLKYFQSPLTCGFETFYTSSPLCP